GQFAHLRGDRVTAIRDAVMRGAATVISTWPGAAIIPARIRRVPTPISSLDRLAPGVLLSCAVAQRPGGISDSRSRSVGDDVGDLGAVVPVVLVVEVLDHFFASTGLNVDVD